MTPLRLAFLAPMLLLWMVPYVGVPYFTAWLWFNLDLRERWEAERAAR